MQNVQEPGSIVLTSFKYLYYLHSNCTTNVHCPRENRIFGLVIEHNKMSKLPEKVKAIVNMKQPKVIEEPRRFL